MVFAGPKNRLFAFLPGDTYNIKQVQFREFSLVILWSFLSIYAHPSGSMTHVLTEGGPRPVLGEADSVQEFYSMRARLRQTLIDLLRTEPSYETILPWAEKSQFFNSGDATSENYRAWCRSLPPLRKQRQ